MAADNSWKTIAEVYRNREHKLIQELRKILDKADVDDHTALDLEATLDDHLRSTGRGADSPVKVPVIISPVEDARKELLSLLGVSGAPQSASVAPLQVRTRKVRSDKGKPRGPRRVKNG